MRKIHDAHLAGRWYTSDAVALRREIEQRIERAYPLPNIVPFALVVPHAGHMYSGDAAAFGYALAAHRTVKRALMLAPSHYALFRGAVTLNWDGFRTPLGIVNIDCESVAKLLHFSWIREDAAPFGPEHSLEIQLPFLQVALPGVSVVPLLVGEVPTERARTWGDELASMVDSDTLVLVSSDLTHYGARFDYLPFPPQSADFVRSQLKALDHEAIARICLGDFEAFRRFVDATGATICGRNPVVLFLAMHAQRTSGVLLHYYTSLDITGDYEHVVSYASIAFPLPPPPL
ncbi:MAG: AmmeMemoRadiSam system protein B [Candidatus Binatia bacterium]|nr:AmmeMemoRadiSam system protein B [Candidatus Binatia bacterium]